MIFSPLADQAIYPFTLPQLPYAQDALTPILSAETISYHYGKHQQTYVNNLNKLIENTNLMGVRLEQIIRDSYRDHNLQEVFNNAAQVWNHTFYWHSLTPSGGGEPSAVLLLAIQRDFGSFTNFKEQFKQAAKHFGSGWIWLSKDISGKLHITTTANAATPITDAHQPIIVCDIWEHAHYIDFRNERARYVSSFLENLINWPFAAENYQRGLQI